MQRRAQARGAKRPKAALVVGVLERAQWRGDVGVGAVGEEPAD